MVICDLLGIPTEDREQVHEWTSIMGRNRSGRESGPLLAARQALAEFRRYVQQDVAPASRRCLQQTSDLVRALIGAETDERMSELELTALFVQFLFAGHETTNNLLSIGTLGLLQDREQWELLCADITLADAAADELLRFVSPTQYISRRAAAPAMIGSVALDAGQPIIPILAAANRDPSHFDHPGRLDLNRSNARDHLAFAVGIHFCLGAALARLETSSFLKAVARRFPDMQLAVGPERLSWGGHSLMRRLRELPIVLGRDRK